MIISVSCQFIKISKLLKSRKYFFETDELLCVSYQNMWKLIFIWFETHSHALFKCLEKVSEHAIYFALPNICKISDIRYCREISTFMSIVLMKSTVFKIVYTTPLSTANFFLECWYSQCINIVMFCNILIPNKVKTLIVMLSVNIHWQVICHILHHDLM